MNCARNFGGFQGSIGELGGRVALTFEGNISNIDRDFGLASHQSE